MASMDMRPNKKLQIVALEILEKLPDAELYKVRPQLERLHSRLERFHHRLERLCRRSDVTDLIKRAETQKQTIEQYMHREPGDAVPQDVRIDDYLLPAKGAANHFRKALSQRSLAIAYETWKQTSGEQSPDKFLDVSRQLSTEQAMHALRRGRKWLQLEHASPTEAYAPIVFFCSTAFRNVREGDMEKLVQNLRGVEWARRLATRSVQWYTECIRRYEGKKTKRQLLPPTCPTHSGGTRNDLQPPQASHTESRLHGALVAYEETFSRQEHSADWSMPAPRRLQYREPQSAPSEYNRTELLHGDTRLSSVQCAAGERGTQSWLKQPPNGDAAYHMRTVIPPCPGPNNSNIVSLPTESRDLYNIPPLYSQDRYLPITGQGPGWDVFNAELMQQFNQDTMGQSQLAVIPPLDSQDHFLSITGQSLEWDVFNAEMKSMNYSA